MVAINFMVGTKYECNDDQNKDQIWMKSWQKGDQIWLQFQFRIGRYKIAIPFKRDQIWLQCRKSSWSHVTMISGPIPRKRFLRFQPYQVRIESDCNHIRSKLLSSLQSYLVPFVTIIAIIFGPHGKIYCNDKRSSPIEPSTGGFPRASDFIVYDDHLTRW